jgi:hypothetical protein
MFNQVENEVELKPGTLICNSHSLCYYVDPDDIETLTASKLGV